MTKDFYEKNYEVFVSLIKNCQKIEPACCFDCIIGDACLYYLTGDDSEFKEEN